VISRLAIVFIVLYQCPPGIAAEVENLYGSQAIVTGTEEPERTRGFGAALRDVLVKLTGNATLARDRRLDALCAQPHRFVDHFEYEDRMKNIPVHDEQGTRERPHYLRVVFKKTEIDAALRRLHLPKWGPDRPLIAVWLGIRTARASYVLTSSGPNGYGQRAVLVETAVRRGLAIWLPPAGQSAVQFDQVAAGNIEALKAASPETGALLVGTLSIAPGGYWDIAWTLHHSTEAENWTLSNVSFDRALEDGLQTSALILSGNTD